MIKDATGSPVQGAPVIIQGSARGTVTDENGNFNLIVPDPQKNNDGEYSTVLAISFVGLETKLVTATTGENELQVNIPDIRMKDGVIVINPKQLNTPPPPPPPVDRDKNTQAPPPPPIKKQEEIFTLVEELPEYPGGFFILGEYINEKKEELGKQKRLTGKSKITFTVSESGKVTDVKIVEQDNEEIGKAAASIVMAMKDWNPGRQRGKPVAVKYLLPIEFN